jgi:hypothetical protein
MAQGAGDYRLLQSLDHPKCDVGRGFWANQVQSENGELIASETRSEIIVAHRARQTLGNDSKHLIANPMTVDIVDLLETIEIHQDHSVNRPFARRSRSRSLECLIKLPAIGKTRERILKSKCPHLLLCGKPKGDFTPLLNVPPHGKGEKPQGHNSAQKQGLVELNDPLMYGYAIGVFEDVILKRQVEADKNDGNENRNVLEAGTVPDHEVPHASKGHRRPVLRGSDAGDLCQILTIRLDTRFRAFLS